MSNSAETITVRSAGLDPQEWTIPADPYVTLRDFVTATEFLQVTRLNPNKLTFSVNGERADDDLLLVSGDVVTFDIPGEKALISARDAIKKLRRLVGLYFDCHGKRHDHWRTQDGRRVDFPRHARDLAIDTLRSIIRQAGLQMSVDEFLQA